MMLLTCALAIWPAGQVAIGQPECYWASVPAEGNKLGLIFLSGTLYLYQALVAGLDEQ